MARKIVSICDAHLDDEEHAGTALPPISLDGVTFFAVDLCDVADKETIEPVRRLLAEYGRRLSDDDLVDYRRGTKKKSAAKKSSSDRRMTCPKCQREMTRGTLRDHVEKAHDTLLPIVEAELGHTLEGDPITDYCPDCGGGFGHGAGRSAHERSGRCREWLARHPERRQQQLAAVPDEPAPAKKAAKKTAAKKAAKKA